MKKEVDTHIYTIVLILMFTFGTIILFFVYQDLQARSFSRIQYEYETFKSYFDLPDDVLQKLLYGASVTGRLSFVGAFEFEDNTLIMVRNTGEIPLTGFVFDFNGMDVETSVKPQLLLPGTNGALIVKTSAISGPGTLVVLTDQGVSLQLFQG